MGVLTQNVKVDSPNEEEFPSPREDYGGSNEMSDSYIYKMMTVSVPSRRLGGLTQFIITETLKTVSFRTLARIRGV